MKNKILLLTLLLALAAAPAASAELVTLNNGRVMTGRIVEKNQKYLVLQSGEGAMAVKTTIFLEDISRIDGEQTPMSPFGDSRQAIRNLVQQDLLLKARANASEGGFEAPDVMIGADNLQRTPDVSQGAATAEELEGPGEISGMISLPYSPAAKPSEAGASGALYVYLTKEGGNGEQVLTSPALYDRIDAQNITSMLVPYVIRGIPFGRYEVVATWDVASPPITEAVISGKKALNMTIEKGDYQGTYGTAVEASPATSQIGGINFDCATFKEANIYKKEPQTPGAFFEIKDVYFTKSEEQGKFSMIIKNTGAQPIRRMFLAIAIASQWMPFPVVVEEIPSGAEKTIDITPYYDQYLATAGIPKRGPSGETPFTFVRIRIRMPNGGDSIFEKTVEIF